MTERTAQQEYDFLISREEHRKPIDAFFRLAIEGIQSGATALELGPGPLTDIRDALTAKGLMVAQSDTRPAHRGIREMEPMWSRERRLPWIDDAFAHVFAREVFEHVFHLREMIAEVHRVLAPGGQLWFSTVFAFPLHDYEPPHDGDFWRLSPMGWERLLDETGFVDAKIETARELFGSWQTPISILGTARKS